MIRKEFGLLVTLLCTCIHLGCEDRGPPPSSGEDEAPETRAGTEGRLIIVGGALQADNTAIYQAVLDGRSGEGPLCVLPTASGTPGSSMDEYVRAFDALGGPGTAQGILLTLDNRGRAFEEEIADLLRGCGGFFFTGGSQSRIVEVFLPEGDPTPAYHALWERFQAGAAISGSSAGAAIMTDPMIAGGNSIGALRDGIQTGGDGEGVLLTRGLGFLKVGLVDQHFLARGRWVRLLVGILGSDGSGFGFGVDENTALVVAGDSAWVEGESGVTFLDARSAAREAHGNGGYGVRMFLLGAGDGVNLRTGDVWWDEGKTRFPEEGEPFSDPHADLFSSGTLPLVLFELATAPDQRLTFKQEGHFFEFRKEPGFRAMGWDGMGSYELPAGLFMGPFVLSVRRE